MTRLLAPPDTGSLISTISQFQGSGLVRPLQLVLHSVGSEYSPRILYFAFLPMGCAPSRPFWSTGRTVAGVVISHPSESPPTTPPRTLFLNIVL